MTAHTNDALDEPMVAELARRGAVVGDRAAGLEAARQEARAEAYRRAGVAAGTRSVDVLGWVLDVGLGLMVAAVAYGAGLWAGWW